MVSLSFSRGISPLGVCGACIFECSGHLFIVCRHGHICVGFALLLVLHFRYFVGSLSALFGHRKRRRIHGLDLGGDILGLRLGCWGFTLKLGHREDFFGVEAL